MFLTPYIYESNISSNQAKILIILPDIFGLNKGNKQMYKPDFYNEKSVAQILEENPEITKSKDFLLFFGDLDQSIPLVEINMTQNLLNSQSKSYNQVIYANANHAFFNKERSSFVPEIYDEIVDKIKNFLN